MNLCESTGQSYANTHSQIFVLAIQEQATSAALPKNSQQIILRITAAALADLDLASFEKQVASRANSLAVDWKPFTYPDPPVSVFGPGVSEASLLRVGSSWIVVSLQFQSPHIKLCKASDVLLPWTCELVAEVDRIWQVPGLITYAAKAHPQLLRHGCNHDVNDGKLRLVISYVSNSLLGPSELFEPRNRDVYTPKFLLLESK